MAWPKNIYICMKYNPCDNHFDCLHLNYLNILRCVCDIIFTLQMEIIRVNALIRQQTEEVDKFSPHFLLEDKISGIIG